MYCSTTSLVTCQGQIWDSHPSKYVMPKDKDRHHRQSLYSFCHCVALMKTMKFQRVSFSETEKISFYVNSHAYFYFALAETFI